MTKQKEQTTEIIKEPKTMKVSTVVISVVVLFAIIGSFIAGWHLNSLHAQTIESKADAKAAHMVQLSKSVE